MSPLAIYTDLCFPVIWIGKKTVRASDDLLHLRTCDSGLFKAGFRKNGLVVDAKLVCREVLSTKKSGYAPPLWGFRLPGLRYILIDYEWSGKQPRVVTLDEVKRMIVEAKRTSGMYVGMAGSPKPYERKILNFQSFDEIVRYFGRPSRKGYFRRLWFDPFEA